jgi:hypothetical protein
VAIQTNHDAHGQKFLKVSAGNVTRFPATRPCGKPTPELQATMKLPTLRARFKALCVKLSFGSDFKTKWRALPLILAAALLLGAPEARAQQNHFPTKGERAVNDAMDEMERHVINSGGKVLREAAPRNPYGVGNPALYQDYNFTKTSEAKERQERDRAWVERCNPTIVKGDDGVRRYTYSRSDCP